MPHRLHKKRDQKLVDLSEQQKQDLLDALVNEVYKILYGETLGQENLIHEVPPVDVVNWTPIVRSARVSREHALQTKDLLQQRMEQLLPDRQVSVSFESSGRDIHIPEELYYHEDGVMAAECYDFQFKLSLTESQYMTVSGLVQESVDDNNGSWKTFRVSECTSKVIIHIDDLTNLERNNIVSVLREYLPEQVNCQLTYRDQLGDIPVEDVSTESE